MDRIVKYKSLLFSNQRMEAENSNNIIIRMNVKYGDECFKNKNFLDEAIYHRYVMIWIVEKLGIIIVIKYIISLLPIIIMVKYIL